MESPEKRWLQGFGFTRVLLTVGVISTVHSAIFRMPVAAQEHAELTEAKQQEQLLNNRQQAIQKNITLLQDQDAEISNSAARTLIGLEAKEATSQLLSLLQDPDALVRANAVYILDRLQAKEAIPQLIP